MLNCQPRCAGAGGGGSVEAVGQFATEQRQVLCGVGSVGTGQRPGVVSKGHKYIESTLAEEKCIKEKRVYRVVCASRVNKHFPVICERFFTNPTFCSFLKLNSSGQNGMNKI